MVYGYARVSSREQNLTRQIEQLKNYVTDERYIITDKISGKDFQRPGYNLLVGTPTSTALLREGDLLIITSLDRLGRNYVEIQEQWKQITTEIKANISVLDMPLLNTSVTNNNLDGKFIATLVLQILSYVAEKERLSIKERQRQGIDVMPIVNGKRVYAKTGNPTGRPPKKKPEGWDKVFNEWEKGEITATQAMKVLDLKRTMFYTFVKRQRAGTN